MILINGEGRALEKIIHLDGAFRKGTVILMGGAPTIKEQPLHLLSSRGVVSAAINNAARHFRPTLWFSGDNPLSFEPQILLDPGIMKFSPHCFAKNKVHGREMHEIPNTYFYVQTKDVELGEVLSSPREVPWYYNTLFAAIHILYRLGFRRIILGGSDFEAGEKQMYAHDTELSEEEWELNRRLYRRLVDELISCRSIFKQAGLELYDCSVKSKLGGTYPVLTMEEAVDLCRENFPAEMVDPTTLKHGTRFATDDWRKRMKLMPLEDLEKEAKSKWEHLL
jgi:hypothetical protein